MRDFPHPLTPSPKEGEGEPEPDWFFLPLSPLWERGPGGEGDEAGDLTASVYLIRAPSARR